ncbi:hypothetical protein B0I72DRAFT_135677 [Yarrowia lipolytica]|jgi:hypothetical protein|uniref:RING-type E3 ubiquitin transferase n=2 Tax=Yarrowia lipolytica TaxID=4952 RepID=Q6C679_YARLI|nr:YALI0E11737p [Yarrowia lipolytica CLIB122]AOW05293.1 hypothetical protein YALI1_E14561g [Yarrowia lipolytica]KAB8283814.1 hypothetical protein BKA91DRAFT_136182 [Yarrowia lipolytica]KAE8172739.1 hypothetical protein BKA90DRAFT_136820 [Yarrowia lipolytica]KAJ8056812.1 hypothetical protein LXG23DRAFT_46248 [Yarrowia lipolytica]QNP98920.1 Hypothetical protein YALI2_E00236g [Yarrowia lipolytica]|eukprot:XP_503833.1 YALI0E11737p [Yarrowia lipolytica CLIB122]
MKRDKNKTDGDTDSTDSTPDDTTATDDMTDDVHDLYATDATSPQVDGDVDQSDVKTPGDTVTQERDTDAGSDTETESDNDAEPLLSPSQPHNVHKYRGVLHCGVCSKVVKHGVQVRPLPCKDHVIHTECVTGNNQLPSKCMSQKCSPSSNTSTSSDASPNMALPKVILTVQDFERDYPVTHFLPTESEVTYCLVCQGIVNPPTQVRTMPCGHKAHASCIPAPLAVPDKCRFCRRDNHYRREQELLDGYDPALYANQNLPVYPGRSDEGEDDDSPPPAHSPPPPGAELGLPTYEEATEWTEETK